MKITNNNSAVPTSYATPGAVPEDKRGALFLDRDGDPFFLDREGRVVTFWSGDLPTIGGTAPGPVTLAPAGFTITLEA